MLAADGTAMPFFRRGHRCATAMASSTHIRINTTGIGTGPTLDISPPVQSATACMVEASRPGCKCDARSGLQATLRGICMAGGRRLQSAQAAGHR